MSLADNQAAIELSDEFDEAAVWTGAIAATGLENRPEARRLWAMAGISLPDGEGPIEFGGGRVVVRLNPSASGETVWMTRIDPLRARPERAPTGERAPLRRSCFTMTANRTPCG